MNYNDILACLEENLDKIRQFLDLPLDLEKMVAAIDLNLHRQRDDMANPILP